MEPLVLGTGAAAAIVLLEPGHQDAVYELVGEAALTQVDVATILARELGRQPTTLAGFVRRELA